MKGAVIGGAGRTVEVDGCYVGGYVRPENEKKDRKDRRLAESQTGKRRVVVAMRERGSRTLTAVFASEAESVAFFKARVDGATTIHADEASDWNALHARFATKRINHQDAYSLDGSCTNEAGRALAPAALQGHFLQHRNDLEAAVQVAGTLGTYSRQPSANGELA